MLQDLMNTVAALGLAVFFAATFVAMLWVPALSLIFGRWIYGASRHELAAIARHRGPDVRETMPLHHRHADPLP